ncbi:MAG: hypothetical protein AMXMBFR13_28500 [Phycisphaerae bacterium]
MYVMLHPGVARGGTRLAMGCGLLAILGAGSGCVSPPPGRTAWLGLNTHVPETTGWTARPTDERSEPVGSPVLAPLRELSVPMIRDRLMDWSRVQPAPDARYDFSTSDAVIREAQAAGADVLVLFAGIPAWAAGTGPGGSPPARLPAREHAPAFASFVRSFVERYDGDAVEDMRGLRYPIRAYEFQSEIESLPTAEYAFWLRTFHDAVRKADSRTVISLGSLRSPGVRGVHSSDSDDPDWFEQLLAEPALQRGTFPPFQAISFINYPPDYPGRVEFADALAYLRRVMADHGLNLPIWLTEYGGGGVAADEHRQAHQVVKWALQARAQGIDRVYLGASREESIAGKNQSLLSGLVKPGEAGVIVKTPAFNAFAALLHELRRRPAVSRRAPGLYMLSGEGPPVFVMWQDEEFNLTSFLSPGWWEIRDFDGRTFLRQGADVQVTEAPKFLQRVRSPFIR